MSVITAGSPMVRTQINLVQELIRLGPIKDSNLANMVRGPLKWQRARKKGGLLCQCSATQLQLPPCSNHCSPYVACSSVLLDVV